MEAVWENWAAAAAYRESVSIPILVHIHHTCRLLQMFLLSINKTAYLSSLTLKCSIWWSEVSVAEI